MKKERFKTKEVIHAVSLIIIFLMALMVLIRFV